ncbi:MAG: hypothetical protein J1E98_01130 [Lachnospiraceae bacterium]|nr:hypothetical protein [Lachnospiraceae bacterium]
MDKIQNAAIQFKECAEKYTNVSFEISHLKNNTYLVCTTIMNGESKIIIMCSFETNNFGLIIYMPDCRYDFDLMLREVTKLNSLFTTYSLCHDLECKALSIRCNISLEVLQEYTQFVILMMQCVVKVLVKIANTNKTNDSNAIQN